MPGKYTNVCERDRVGIVASAKKVICITQKEVTETEINARAYGQE